MYIVLPVMDFLLDFMWYDLVAVMLSSSRPRRFYLDYRRVIDRLSGGVMVLLGLRLLLK